MDTDAKVTALSDTTFHLLNNPELQLRKLNQTLHGPNCSPLDVLGEANFELGDLQKQDKYERVFVIHNLQHNLRVYHPLRHYRVVVCIPALDN